MGVSVAFSGVAGGVSAIAPMAAPSVTVPPMAAPPVTVPPVAAMSKAIAQATPIGQLVTVDVDSLVVRAEPGLGGAAVGSLAFGASAVVIDGPVAADGYDWYLLQQDGVAIGWSVRGFVPSGGAGTPITPVGQGGSLDIQIGGTVSVNVASLVVRAEPSLNGAAVGSLLFGAEATVIDGPVVADGYEWFLLEQDGLTIGWSVQGFVQIAAPPVVAPSKAGPPGDAPPESDAGQVPAAQTVFTVTAGFFEVRAEPDESAGVARIVTVGTQLTQTGETVEEDGLIWFPVDDDGWVGGGTGGESGGLFLELYPLFVTADVLNVRSEPSLSGTIVQTLSLGDTVNVFDSVRDDDGLAWSAVNEDGTLWVASQYLTIQLDEVD